MKNVRKLLLCVTVFGVCLLPSARPSAAALPCNSWCCNPNATATSPCMNTPGVWTTCGWYLERYACP